MRWVLGFCLGTLCSVAFLGVFTLANGTPLPPLNNWAAMARYPTGSVATTLEIMWIFYFTSFVLVFSLAWLGRKVSSRGRRSEPSGHMQDRPPTRST